MSKCDSLLCSVLRLTNCISKHNHVLQHNTNTYLLLPPHVNNRQVSLGERNPLIYICTDLGCIVSINGLLHTERDQAKGHLEHFVQHRIGLSFCCSTVIVSLKSDLFNFHQPSFSCSLRWKH